MQRLLSTVTLAAFLASSLAGPLPVLAQAVSAETSQRLREAVARLNGDGAGREDVADLSSDELDLLLAPYALYPDSLLAQILVAASRPLQIAQADQLITDSADMTDQELADTLEGKDWDPSVLVLLSGFPTVITRMADDLEATERLGNAMIGQDEDVLASVQRLRSEAERAGNLSSNQAQIVTRDADRISIRPAKPDVVYVPHYDPKTVYVTNPAPTIVQQPATDWNGQNMLIAGAVAFGSALLVQQLFDTDDDRNSGWDDYWHRDDVIDWRGHQIYPRSGRYDRPVTWSQERDQYWDRTDRDWRYDADAYREHEIDRRATMRWTESHRDQPDPRDISAARFWREKARKDSARLEAAREARAREARLRRAHDAEAEKDAARREAVSDRAREERAKKAARLEREERRAAEVRRAAEERARHRREAAEAREKAAARDHGKPSKDHKPKPARLPEDKGMVPVISVDRKPKAETHKTKTEARAKPDREERHRRKVSIDDAPPLQLSLQPEEKHRKPKPERAAHSTTREKKPAEETRTARKPKGCHDGSESRKCKAGG